MGVGVEEVGGVEEVREGGFELEESPNGWCW